MKKLLEQAKKFLEENPNLNEIELSDGINKIRIIRNSPVIWYYQPTPTYTTPYQY